MASLTSVINKKVLASLGRSGAPRFFHRVVLRRRLSILTYHSIVREDLPISDFCFVNLSTFVEHISYLKKHCRVLPLGDAVGRMRAGALDGPSVAITFDDGYQNNCDVAFPVLREAGFPATIFLTTDLIGTQKTLWPCHILRALSETSRSHIEWNGRKYPLSDPPSRVEASAALQAMLRWLPPSELRANLDGILRKLDYDPERSVEPDSPYRMLSESAVREMADSGLIQFGAHTTSHSNLKTLSDEECRYEISESIDSVTELTGTRCTLFAFPFGSRDDFDNRSVAVLQECGIEASVTTEAGPNTRAISALKLRRYGVGPGLSRAEFGSLVHHFSYTLRRWRSKQKTEPVRILVTDAQELAGLGAIRSLGRAGYFVVAASPENGRRPPGGWSRYCAKEVRYPDPWTRQMAFRDWLRAEAAKETFDVLLPVSEASVVGAAAVRAELPSGLDVIIPFEECLNLTLSKYNSTRRALALDIPCPATVFVHDGDPSSPWCRDLSELSFPVVIKSDNVLGKDGAYVKGRALYAENDHDAQRILSDLEGSRTRIVAQEFIPGTGAGAFFLRYRGKQHLAFAHRRIHEVPYTGGWSSYRQGCHDEDLLSTGNTLLESMNYQGVAMVEFRRSSQDGKAYFLEINGRLWGSIALALHSRADFPRMLVECYQQGLPYQDRHGIRPGVRCRNIFSGEIQHLVSILRAKHLATIMAPPSKMKAVIQFISLSLNPRVFRDFFWLSDPGPGIVQATRETKEIGLAVLRRLKRDLAHAGTRRKLAKLRAQHNRRAGRGAYFDTAPKQVLFVCFGNLCRSPFAERYWENLRKQSSLTAPEAFSTGLHSQEENQPPPHVINAAREFGVQYAEHRPHMVSRNDIQRADAVFVMDSTNYHGLIARFPSIEHKLFFLGWFANREFNEIEDPYLLSVDQAVACFEKMKASLDGLWKASTTGTDSET